METRDKAYEDYKKGLKYKEIAQKYDVSENTVKSWASRYWKKDKVATKSRNRKNKVATKKKKQTSTGKPKGPGAYNTNALKHGGYSTIYWDTLDEEEKELIETMSEDEEMQLIEQLRLYAVRERRILRAIKMLNDSKSKSGAIEVASGVGFSIENEDKQVISSNGDFETISETKTKPSWSNKRYERAELAILRLETELTSVQRNKTRCIQALADVRKNKADGSADGWLEDFLRAVEGEDDE